MTLGKLRGNTLQDLLREGGVVVIDQLASFTGI
jgi:hypothetical protein